MEGLYNPVYEFHTKNL